jgi:2-polyprenyl-3-methyl-5-hydroxy-6-metoxy-1,4-benzoquinol methylase
MRLPKVTCVRRLDYILENCRGRKVLNLGCASSPTTRQRYEEGRLLHSRVQEVAAECWGLDLDGDALEYLEAKGVRNLYTGNVERLDETALPGSERFDLILACELIEHLCNPGLFLDGVAQRLRPRGCLLLSTVNAFPIKRLFRVMWRNEVTYAEHTAYYTYSTLKKLLSYAGFCIQDFHVYYLEDGDLYFHQPLRSRVANAFLRRLPIFNYLADGFVFTARLRGFRSGHH